jgi:hypothetical protein
MVQVTSERELGNIGHQRPKEAAGCGMAVPSRDELCERAPAWPMRRLVEIWNGLRDLRPVKRFENRAIAVARICRAMERDAERHGAPLRFSGIRTARRSTVSFASGSKAAHVCTLLERAEGATLEEIRAATSWQAHTVRGFISRALRKQGRTVHAAGKNGKRVYRLTS